MISLALTVVAVAVRQLLYGAGGSPAPSTYGTLDLSSTDNTGFCYWMGF